MKLLVFDDLQTWYSKNEANITTRVLTQSEFGFSFATSDVGDDVKEADIHVQEEDKKHEDVDHREPNPPKAKRVKFAQADDDFKWWIANYENSIHKLQTERLASHRASTIQGCIQDPSGTQIEAICGIYRKTRRGTPQRFLFMPQFFPRQKNAYYNPDKQRECVLRTLEHVWLECSELGSDNMLEIRFMELVRANTSEILKNNLKHMLLNLAEHLSQEKKVVDVFVRSFRIAMQNVNS